MQTISTQKCKIVYEERDAETARIVQGVCQKTEDLIAIKWNLSLPKNTQVHIMRSWLRFPFTASPWFRKLLLVISLPIWSIRAKRLWAFSGGWALPYPRHPAIGVKPPDLLQASDRSMGRRIFTDDMDDLAKVKMITCHELTHASAASLKLPAWLNEGIAMVSVDEFFGYQTIQSQTLLNIKNTQPKISPRDYRQLQRADKDTMIYLYIRGYWLTRYIDQQHHDILRDILSKRRKHSAIIAILSQALNVPATDFWQCIDAIIFDYFKDISPNKESN